MFFVHRRKPRGDSYGNGGKKARPLAGESGHLGDRLAPPSVGVHWYSGQLDEAQHVALTMIDCLENVRSRFAAALGMTSQGFKDRCEVPPSTRP